MARKLLGDLLGSLGSHGVSQGAAWCRFPRPWGAPAAPRSPGKGINHCPGRSRRSPVTPGSQASPRGAGAVSHADALLRDLGRLWGKSQLAGGDMVWTMFWGTLGTPGTGTLISCCSVSRAQMIKQTSSSRVGCRVGRGQNEELPPLCICSFPSPPGQAGCDLCRVSLPWDLCPTVVLPLSFPFSWHSFSFSCSFCSLSLGPFSSFC